MFYKIIGWDMEELMFKLAICRRVFVLLLLCIFSLSTAIQISAQQGSRPESPLYEQLKKFELRGKASVSGLTLKRDRATMTFTGDFYFAAPVDGKITGAVFIGSGKFHAEAPDLPFEKEYMKRFTGKDMVDSEFRDAVLRFNDDTVKIIGNGMDANAAASGEAQSLAKELDQKLLKETGANISARLLIGLSNKEAEGFFLGRFDNKFTYIFDPQTRLPGSAFNVNGGEKTLLFTYNTSQYFNDMWITATSEDEIKNNRVDYSDKFDLVSPEKYKMEVDVREARKILRTRMTIDFESLVDNLTSIPMNINQGLTAFDNRRLRWAMRVKEAKMDGKDITCIQEDWETGLTIVLPNPVKKGDAFSIDLALEGDNISDQRTFENNYYPISNEAWYPTHGYLKRSKYDMTFRHNKTDLVTSVGTLVREKEAWPDAKDGSLLTQYIMENPVSFATFAAGRLEKYSEPFAIGSKEKSTKMQIDLYSLPSSVGAEIKEKFVASEMANALSYFTNYFGGYTFGDFRGTVQPFNQGQGFPTMLLLPAAKGMSEANRNSFSFIAHETSHQWWGNIVAWRSYRDQWLSEGFAEYSGILYTAFRQDWKNAKELIKTARFDMEAVITGDKGNIGKVAESGPMIFGSRLNTRLTQNSYETIIYTKGALVMRMLHFLFYDANSKEPDKAFFAMLADFVKRYENKAATTEEFIQVAGEHFSRTPIARKLGVADLNWFFQQWVFEAKYPSYRLEYSIVEEGGKYFLTGTVYQDNAGPNWVMPLPVVLKIGGQPGQVIVLAKGPECPVTKIALPAKPDSVELDPDLWILSEKTITKKK
jgi:hypothetical protein